MRLTVGPLPPAVYWRRRVVVLGAGLLFVIVLLYSCTGSEKPTSGPQASKSASPTAAGPAAVDPTSGDLLPTASASTPETGLPPAGEGPPSPTTAPATVTPAAAPAAGACTDAEISVRPVPAPTSVKRGGSVDLRLKIRNVSNRTCSRDVGADLQEIYVKIGAQKVWSSDTCGTAKGSDVQSFTPNFEREYLVTWNGRSSNRCDGGLAAGDQPDAGDYQVFGRLGTKISDPVKLTIVAA